jgi:hypothetical protein
VAANKRTTPLAIALVAGIVLWFAASFITGRREPWDSSSYWWLIYPVAIAACGYLGYRYPARAWLAAFILFQAQFVGMVIRNGELGNLWPLGLALFAIIAIPGMIVAALAARVARKAERKAG